MVVISVVDGLVGFVTIFVSKCNFHQSFSRLVVQLVGHLLLVKFNPKPLRIASYQTPHIQSWFNRVQSSELNIYKTQKPTLDVDLLIFLGWVKTLIAKQHNFHLRKQWVWAASTWVGILISPGASTLRVFWSFAKLWLMSGGDPLALWHLNIHQRQLVNVLLLRGLKVKIQKKEIWINRFFSLRDNIQICIFGVGTVQIKGTDWPFGPSPGR